MGDQDDVRVGRRVEGRDEASRPWCEHVAHRLGALGHPLHPQLAQPVDPALPPGAGEVAALGEDHERVVAVEVGGQRRDLLLERVAGSLAGLRGDEARRDPPQQDVDDGVPGQGVLEDDARLPVVPVHQRVHEHERVTRARVPAGDEQRGAGVGVRGRSVGDDREPQHPPRLAEEGPHHPLDQVVVDALPVGTPDPPSAPAGQPEPQQHRQQHALHGQVDHEDPQQPQRPPATRQQRGERGRGDQPERQGHPQQAGQEDDGRGDHQPSDDAGRGGHVCSRR